MSPRAAWRLESLGFSRVYDYAAGLADWLAFGLPTEGRASTLPRAGQIARRDVPICTLQERVDRIRERIASTGWDECLVVNDEGIILGRISGIAFEATPDTTAEAIMAPGPTTIRPDELLAQLVPRMRDRHVARIVVTTPDGRLVGVIELGAAESFLVEREAAETRTE